MTKGSLTYKKEVLIKWWKSLDEDWKLVFNINYFLQREFSSEQILDDFKGMMIPEVFTYHFGKEKLDALRNFDPGVKALRYIVSMKMLLASNCNLRDLSPLKMLPKLKILELESNPVEHLEAVAELTELEDFTMIVKGVKPDQLVISNLKKMIDLTFDPQNQDELEVISAMPQLETFYTELDFSPNLNCLKFLPKLKKIVGTSPSIDENSRQILTDLKKSDVEIIWNTATETI